MKKYAFQKHQKFLHSNFRAATDICPIGYIWDHSGNRILVRTKEGKIKKDSIVTVVEIEAISPHLIVRISPTAKKYAITP